MRNKIRRPQGTLTSGFLSRRVAIDRGSLFLFFTCETPLSRLVSLIVDINVAKLFVEGLRTVPRGPIVSAVDCQSSWDTVTLPSTTGGLVFVTDDNLTETLSHCVASGFTSALVVSKLPINASVTNVPCDYASIYGGSIPSDLTSISQLFSGILLDFEVCRDRDLWCVGLTVHRLTRA